MIPALLIWLFNKYIAPRINRKRLAQKAINLKRTTLLVLFSCWISLSFSQQSKFNIKRNGEVIGQLSFLKKEEGENIFLKITSRVAARFVFKINVETEDHAHFRNGKLIVSEVNRVVNGNRKEAKKTTWISDYYEVLAGNKRNKIAQPINYNMMLLYVKEPINIPKIYSDNFQCFLPIKKNGEHQYRINLPDGNYNDYHFENGICKLIVVNHSLYTIRMERA